MGVSVDSWNVSHTDKFLNEPQIYRECVKRELETQCTHTHAWAHHCSEKLKSDILKMILIPFSTKNKAYFSPIDFLLLSFLHSSCSTFERTPEKWQKLFNKTVAGQIVLMVTCSDEIKTEKTWQLYWFNNVGMLTDLVITC